MSDDEHEQWLQHSLQTMSEVLEVQRKNIILKRRQRKAGRQGQYQRLESEKEEFIVRENGLQFIVNLTDYLDTGLFLDHRVTRQLVREEAANKRVLNLFCYTGSFSVYAAAGGASQVVSVDLSKTYLSWAQRNMQLNFPEFANHDIVHADVKQYLRTVPRESFDVIVMDPPTFSNSKRMEDFLDIQKDHVELINDCLRCLAAGGKLFFSTNYTKFQLHQEQINATNIRDITKATTPFDFAGKLKRWCFLVEK